MRNLKYVVLIIVWSCNSKPNCLKINEHVNLSYIEEYDSYRVYNRNCYDCLDFNGIYFNSNLNYIVTAGFNYQTYNDSFFELYYLDTCLIKEVPGDSIVIIEGRKVRVRDLDFKEPQLYDFSRCH
jgi:hypothetical protein